MNPSPRSGPEIPTTYKQIFYDKYASTHTSHRKGEETQATFKQKIPTWEKGLAPFLSGKLQDKIIDLGCGTGSLVWWLQKRGYANSEGLDISEEQVRIAEKLGVKNVVQGDIHGFMGARPGRFDLIILRDALEHFTKEEVLGILEDCHRALAPEGRILIQVPNAESPFFGRIRYGDFTHDLAFTSSSLSQLFRVSGFTDIRFHPADPVVAGAQSLLRLFLWKGVSLLLKVMLYAELGPGKRIVTQNIIAVATKQGGVSS